MKKILLILFTLMMTSSIFAQVQYVDPSELVKTLEKNRKTDITFVSSIKLNGMTYGSSNNLHIPTIIGERIKFVAEIETELLKERLSYRNLSNYILYFVLRDSKTKTYAVTKIEGIETVAEYKARLEAERLAKLEAERIAEEKRLEEERIAEEKRLEEERIAEEKARLAEEKRQRNEKYLPTYNSHLVKAKEYEKQKRWCYALGSYYDAMGTVDLDPEYKTEAVNGYNNLKEVILAGNPGFGTYNAFSLHDEWKKLLIDAEKYGCSFMPYEVIVGDLVRRDLDYTTKTASYWAEISYEYSNRYNSIIAVIAVGYKKAYKYDWKDLPSEWPYYSASYNNDEVYNVNGAYIYRFPGVYHGDYSGENGLTYHNAFAKQWDDYTLVDCKFNIVDENGKELVKPKRYLLGKEGDIKYEGITPEIMDLIDNGKAFLNPVACYLEYGKYNKEDDKGGRSFIKNFPEIQLPMDTAEFICWKNKKDRNYNTIKEIENTIGKKILPSFDMEKLK